MQNDQEIKQSTTCPVCLHTTHETLYHVDAVLTAEHMFNFCGSKEEVNHVKEIIRTIWNGDTACMLRCGNCQLVFADPFIAGTSDFYSAVYQKDSLYPDWKWDYEITFRDLKSYSIKEDLQQAHMLEVGAGNGAFVSRMAANFFQKENLLCTEYSEYGADQINKIGIRCLSEPLQALSKEEYRERFQFICMFQVLEHIDNLRELFETLNHLTKSGTLLYISVPSEAYRSFYDQLGRYMDTPPNHLTRWNINSFKRLGEEFGWKILDHQIQPMSYSEKLKKLIFDRLEYHGIFNSVKWAGRKLSLIRKIGLALAAGAMLLSYPAAVIKLRSSSLGISQWVKFIKKQH
ncbi:class I SAM-dependent methyltransferase [Bacteroidota bacterium]